MNLSIGKESTGVINGMAIRYNTRQMNNIAEVINEIPGEYAAIAERIEKAATEKPIDIHDYTPDGRMVIPVKEEKTVRGTTDGFYSGNSLNDLR